MNKDQKAGTFIFTFAITLLVVTLILSDGWGRNESLFLNYSFLYGGGGIFDAYYRVHTIPSRYIIALLVIVAGYGVIRFFSLIPPILRKSRDKT